MTLRRVAASAALALVLAAAAGGKSREKEKSRPQLTLVFFTASWCGPCKSVAPILEKARRKYPAQIRLLIFDFDTAVEEVRRWEVEQIPVVIGLARNGELVFRAEGAGRETLRELEAGIARYLEGAGKKGGKQP